MASRKACLDRGKKKGICERYKNEKKKGKGNRRGMKKRTFKLGGGEESGCTVGTRADKNLTELYK